MLLGLGAVNLLYPSVCVKFIFYFFQFYGLFIKYLIDVTQIKEKSDSGSRKRFSVAVNKEIIAKHENGIRISGTA